MKHYISLLFIAISLTSYCQTPQAVNYQGIARDASGTPLISQLLGVELSIHQGAANGTIVYQETHMPTTNQFGLYTLQIGTGMTVVGTFSAITWDTSTYFLEVGIDITGGSNYVSAGTSQLISVPYALYAETSGSSTPGPAGPAGPVGPQGPAGPSPDIPSCNTYLPFPLGSSSGTGGSFTTIDTEGRIAAFSQPFSITVNKLSIECRSVTIPGVVRIGIYSEDGQVQILSITTDTISGSGVITTPVSGITLAPGVYWVVVVPDGTFTGSLGYWATSGGAQNRLYSVSLEPVYGGTLTLSPATLPASFNPATDITISTSSQTMLMIRLDN